MNKHNDQQEVNVGVDTGKQQLDIFIRPSRIIIEVTGLLEGKVTLCGSLIQHTLKSLQGPSDGWLKPINWMPN